MSVSAEAGVVRPSGQAAAHDHETVEAVSLRRRTLVGPSYRSVPAELQRAVEIYAVEQRTAMEAAGGCSHGGVLGIPSPFERLILPAGWRLLGEVLACPARSDYWTSERVALEWWRSAQHRRIAYGNPQASHLACSRVRQGTMGVSRDSVLCLVFKATGAGSVQPNKKPVRENGRV
ncbi:hypothetical protein KBZ18_00670 [Synechococcus sp. Cruz-9H2]|nr:MULTISPECIES: hypothetical protein [unclassified Synechococcus]MCP9818002.1 hypothetical protein [Synechococcus sp. Cruz-9H2]MCP9854398.1 hypothetical protein [Synechococcus sp. Cruz-9C9]MCP9868910.1 hypothetical protein [Synechococcus sp. Cruz-7B9]